MEWSEPPRLKSLQFELRQPPAPPLEFGQAPANSKPEPAGGHTEEPQVEQVEIEPVPPPVLE